MSAKSDRLPGKFRVRGGGSVEYAGFNCGICWEPVKVIRPPVPASVPKLGIFACGCETAVLVFENEPQPNPRNWIKVMSFAATLNGNILVFTKSKSNQGQRK
jgi:hypothetical protein